METIPIPPGYLHEFEDGETPVDWQICTVCEINERRPVNTRATGHDTGVLPLRS